MAFLLGLTKAQLMELDYEELLGWSEYFRRRPVGWRDDNRAALIIMSSLGGGKAKPEDLFESLRILKEQAAISTNTEDSSNFAQKFFERFSARFSEGNPYDDTV